MMENNQKIILCKAGLLNDIQIVVSIKKFYWATAMIAYLYIL